MTNLLCFCVCQDLIVALHSTLRALNGMVNNNFGDKFEDFFLKTEQNRTDLLVVYTTDRRAKEQRL